jgi:hypothetical protein
MKVRNNKFHGNPSSGDRADTCGQRRMHTKLRRTFRDCARTLKNRIHSIVALRTSYLVTLQFAQIVYCRLSCYSNNKQDRHCTYNVALRRGCATIGAVEE